MNKRYLIIGPKMTDNPQTHGGTPVLVEQLLVYMDKNKIEYSFISTQHFGEGRNLINFLYTIVMFLFKLPKSDIVVANVSRNGAYYFSPIALFFTKLFNKRFIFRRFGGNCLELYKKAKGLKKRLIEYVFRNVDVIFFEPKFLVNYFSAKRDNVYWLPNSREPSLYKRDLNKEYKKRFIFLGEVREGKGIREILEASKMLDSSYTIDIYGSLDYGSFTKDSFKEYPNVNYKGLLDNSKVYQTLANSDILLLPSYKEGYPGVIIEAFSVGLPIIATNIPSIKEMTNNSCAILVKPKDAKALASAMKFFTNKNYKKFSKASKEIFKDYDRELVHKRMFKIMEGINND